ncbi:bifunctional riboflavin kinase/FAD synthetase [Flavobacteriaceae bacterium AU392]|nr:bifunctional riboflavin kinase/FAD synthetase [Flavobacteriaceae bacterium]RKM84084.1 bifunctional riboflavin kinase/FAD synthetase [Flavobacteriaceae bacterium AU392]
MQNLKDYRSYISNKKSVITIGTFDGVHIGHQKIISKLIEDAKQNDLDAIILTFFPHPRMVLQKDKTIKLINTLEEKAVLLKNLGVNHLVVKEFTEEFSKLSASEFVNEVLINKLNIDHIIIGYDHRFGKNRSADINDLRSFGDNYNFKVSEITVQEVDDVAISSTKIRKALLEGNIKKANTYLGYNFMLSGTVIKGKGIGRQLGYPTANIKIKENYKLIPKRGAYIIKSIIDNKEVFGMLNIGINPTVNGEFESIEANFFNFKKDIYDMTIEIQFLERLRNEQKFESIDALKTQLAKDKIIAQEFVNDKNE